MPQGTPSPTGFAPGGIGGPAPVPGAAPLAPPAGDGGGALAPLVIDPINIITNEAAGNLQIPDELILYLADDNQGVSLIPRSAWLTADQGYIHVTADNTITFDDSASGTIDLGGGNEITFLNIEQIAYTAII